MHEYEELEPFWKRYNKVLLDKVTLDKERQVLLQENGQLRSLLKQYLDGISVNEEILSKVRKRRKRRKRFPLITAGSRSLKSFCA